MAVSNRSLPLFLFSALFTLLPVAAGGNASELVGRVRDVIDGSSFYLCNSDGCTNVRICGIDAPHQGQSGWARSLMGLHTLIDNQMLRCVPLGEGTVCDGRTRNRNPKAIIAQCFLGENADIAALLVKRAFACDWVRFSGGHYSAADPGAACSPP
jgi:micrococcal nuclease